MDGITGQAVAAAAVGVLETTGDSDWLAAGLTGGLNYAITLTPHPGLAAVQLVIRDASGEALSEPWVVSATSEPGEALAWERSFSDPESPLEAPEPMAAGQVRSGRHHRGRRGGHRDLEQKGWTCSPHSRADSWGLTGGWDQAKEHWSPGINRLF